MSIQACTKVQRVPVNLKKQSSGVIGSRIRVRVRAGGEGDLPAQRPVARPVSEDKPFQTVLVEDDGVSVEGVIKLDKQEAPRRPWKRVAVLVGGDVLALLIFAAIGRLSHGMPVLVAGWLLGAYFLGGYESEGLGVNGVVKAVFVATKSWAVGIPLLISLVRRW